MKIPRKIDLGPIEPLTKADLEILRQPREQAPWQPKTLRDSHHRIARMFAAGLRQREIAEITGYTTTRLGILRRSPAMIELVAEYRKDVHEAWVKAQEGYAEIATSNMIAAERHIADYIDELDAKDELLPVRTALAISRDAADRFGFHKKSTNFNVNMDFAAQLEAAIKRSGKVVEGEAEGPHAGPSADRGPDLKLVEARPLPPDEAPRAVADGPPLAPKAEARPTEPAGPRPRIARRF